MDNSQFVVDLNVEGKIRPFLEVMNKWLLTQE